MKFSTVKRVLVSSLLLSGGIGVALAQQDVDIAQQDADNSGGGDYDPCYIHSGCGSDVSWVDDGSGVFGDGWYCMDGVTPDCDNGDCDACQITPGCDAGPTWNGSMWVCSTGGDDDPSDGDYVPAQDQTPQSHEQLHPSSTFSTEDALTAVAANPDTTDASPATADDGDDQEPYGSDAAAYDPCYIHSGCDAGCEWTEDGSAGQGWYCSDGVECSFDQGNCDNCQITPGCDAGPVWDDGSNMWVCSA